ncbi:MAG TPA: aldose epimerase family protein [Gemmatimonadales bacterium]|jgi:aldose 1-epimerase
MPPRITQAVFGHLPDGSSVEGYTISNAHGLSMHVITWGAIITAIRVPDRAGHMGDIVLGFDSLSGYLNGSPYIGAIVGRYANRIAKGRFTLDGHSYQLPVNNGPNSLHGGLQGFDKVVWNAAPFESDTGAGLVLTHTSPDGDNGYPGRVDVQVRYTLNDHNELIIEYLATTNKATPLNLSQHSYFNLTGDAHRDILDHVLRLDAGHFTPVDSTLIPTGDLPSVAGTPFDFRTATAIGARIDRPDEQLRFGHGYDHNFVVDRNGAGVQHVARVVEPASGRTLDVLSDQPGVQFYSGNFLDGTLRGKGGRVYQRRFGFCLETQHFPDSPNHPAFASTILRPGERFTSRTIFRFGVAG